MKIVFIAHGASNGGAGRVSSILCNELARKGHQVTYYAFHYSNVSYPIDPAVNYVILHQKSGNRILTLLYRNRAIYEYIKKSRPDLVISFAANIMSYTVMKWKGPVIYSLRNDPSSVNAGMIGKRIRDRLYRRAKAIVFQTPGARDYFPEEIRRKGVIIGNPIREDLPCWRLDQAEDVIMTACRLDSQKNVSLLLKAFRLVHEKHPSWSLRICGDGPLMEQLKKESAELGISDRVEFMGFCDNINELMVRSSIFALSSDFEGLSNSMLEALATGLPTVCTDCSPGGAALYIQNGVNGFLTPVGNHVAFAEALCRLIEDRSLRAAVSSEAVKIRERLSTEQIVSEWDAVISKN